MLLGASWALLGRFWPLLGRSWALLGGSWAALGRSWVALGRLLGVCWAPQRPRRGPGGARRPQRDGQEAPRASPGQTACTTAAGRENERAQRARENERAQRARDGLTRDPGNARDLPRDHHTTIPRETYLYRDTIRPRKTREIYRETTRHHGHRDRCTFSAGAPEHGKRARFTVGPPDKRGNLGGQPMHQQLFLTPLSVFSLGRFGAWRGASWGSFWGFFGRFRAPRAKPRKA